MASISTIPGLSMLKNVFVTRPIVGIFLQLFKSHLLIQEKWSTQPCNIYKEHACWIFTETSHQIWQWHHNYFTIKLQSLAHWNGTFPCLQPLFDRIVTICLKIFVKAHCLGQHQWTSIDVWCTERHSTRTVSRNIIFSTNCGICFFTPLNHPSKYSTN